MLENPRWIVAAVAIIFTILAIIWPRNTRSFLRKRQWQPFAFGFLAALSWGGFLYVVVSNPNKVLIEQFASQETYTPDLTAYMPNINFADMLYAQQERVAQILAEVEQVEVTEPVEVPAPAEQPQTGEAAPAQPVPEAPVAEAPTSAPPQGGIALPSENDAFEEDASQNPAWMGYNYPGGQLKFLIDPNLYPGSHQEVLVKTIQSLNYVTQRTGLSFSGPIQIIYNTGQNISGNADVGHRNIYAYTMNGAAINRPVTIMAHEAVHQLLYDRFSNRDRDVILDEGFATWGAGEYWLGGYPDFRAYHRGEYGDGNFRSLDFSPYTNSDVSTWNQTYYEWASFVEFLIQLPGNREEGLRKFYELYDTDAKTNSPNEIFPKADYQKVYGKTFQEMEAEWRAWMVNW